MRSRIIGVLLLLVLVPVFAVSVGASRFHRRVAREMQSVGREALAHPPLHAKVYELDELPAPVRRYLARALPSSAPGVRLACLRHGGTLRLRADQPWMDVRGEEVLSAWPPAFVWRSRLQPAPGVRFGARDCYLAGSGNMWIRLYDAFTIAEARGPEMDQSNLLRLLAEFVWLPTGFLPGGPVRWEPVDDQRARAVISDGEVCAAALVTFSAEGLMECMETQERYREVDGRMEQVSWSGRYSDWREVGGLLIPFALEAVWQLDDGPLPYARFAVEKIVYDRMPGEDR